MMTRMCRGMVLVWLKVLMLVMRLGWWGEQTAAVVMLLVTAGHRRCDCLMQLMWMHETGTKSEHRGRHLVPVVPV